MYRVSKQGEGEIVTTHFAYLIKTTSPQRNFVKTETY